MLTLKLGRGLGGIIRRLLNILGVCCWSSLLLADLHQSADIELLWLDNVSRPSRYGLGSTRRTMGLKHLNLNWMWQTQSSAVNLLLRPDALLDGRRQIFDSRSGPTYRQRAALKFLQEYQLLLRWEGAELGFGVWGGLLPKVSPYDPSLGHSLQALFPEGFSAVRLTWRNGVLDPGWGLQLVVFQGSGERAENIDGTGLQAEDSYPGIGLSWFYSQGPWQQDLLIAYEEQGGDTPARLQTLYLFGGWRYHWSLRSWDFQHSLGLRWSQDSWDARVASQPTQQASAAWHSKAAWTPSQAILLGIQLGFSERVDLGTYRGYQIELGWESELREHLFSQLMLAEERRWLSEDDSNGSPLRRFAWSLRYAIPVKNY